MTVFHTILKPKKLPFFKPRTGHQIGIILFSKCEPLSHKLFFQGNGQTQFEGIR